MIKRIIGAIVTCVLACGFVFAEMPASGIKDVTVYSDYGKFCGWPANNGTWSWGDEILVCFDLHTYRETDRSKDPTDHHVDWDKGYELVMARSLDGGETWKLERPDAFSVSKRDAEVVPVKDPINFTHKDFAMRALRDKFWVSYDRGKLWVGPYKLGNEEIKVSAKTDYVVNGRNDCLFFVRTPKVLMCVETKDGGKSFELISDNVAPGSNRPIMPSTTRLADGKLLTAVRQLGGEPNVSWIDVFESSDNGRNWKFLSKVANADNRYWNGNPPSIAKLRDGRVAVTYGYRAVPYGIRAKLSSDGGKSWADEIVLRQDGLNWDLGYSRSVQRTDGKIVTMYYYATALEPNEKIAATIWDPDVVHADSIKEKSCEEMASRIDQIETAMAKVKELSAGKVKSVNPLVWWTQEKETACQRISQIISDDFLGQWIKPTPDRQRGSPHGNRERIRMLQEMLYWNFQAKKYNDPAHVKKLRELLEQFEDSFFRSKL